MARRHIEVEPEEIEAIEIEDYVPRPKRRRPIVEAHADGDGFSAMTVRDERGNAAQAVTMSTQAIEHQFLLLELKAEKRRHRKEEEREKMIKNVAIAGGVGLALWLLFIRPRTPATATKT